MTDRTREMRRRVLDAVRRGLSPDQARLEIASLYELQVADATWVEVWAESVQRVAADPPVRSREEATAYLESVRAAVQAHAWSRHGAGDRDRAVMDAILELLLERGHIRTDAGTRLLAERAGGMTHQRAARPIGVLEAEGWLSWEPPASRQLRRGGFATHAIKVHRSRRFPDGCLFGRVSPHDSPVSAPCPIDLNKTGTVLDCPGTGSRSKREPLGSSAEPPAPAAGEFVPDTDDRELAAAIRELRGRVLANPRVVPPLVLREGTRAD